MHQAVEERMCVLFRLILIDSPYVIYIYVILSISKYMALDNIRVIHCTSKPFPIASHQYYSTTNVLKKRNALKNTERGAENLKR